MKACQLVTGVVIAGALTACGEYKLEPLPPIPRPTIVTGNLKCDVIQTRYHLKSASVTVENLDGVDALGDPIMHVGSLYLPKDEIEIETFPPMGEGDKDAALSRPGVDTRIRYTWRRADQGGVEVLCSAGPVEDGKGLTLTFEVVNAQGFRTPPATFPSGPEE